LRYRFISERQDYSVAKWAVYLSVSRSGYYTWLQSHEVREEKRSLYAAVVRSIFEESKGTYGAERISGAMRRIGHKASFRRVNRCMGEQGLKSLHLHCRKRSLTDSIRARGEGYPNLIADLEIKTPFQVLSSDISYIRTKEGFEYLCQVRDVASGIVVSHRTSERMKADFVADTIRQMLKRWALPVGCVFHSDRGSQYTSGIVKELLSRHGLLQSYSRIGKPGDNSWSESFFANLKKEAVNCTHFKTREEARNAMFAYIEGFYNTKRIQRRLGYLSPMQWLEEWYSNNSISAA